jgi:hypothetical protein
MPYTQLITVDDVAELFRRYHQQTDAQPAFAELDPTSGYLRASFAPEIGNAVPAAVAHGLRRRYPIPVLHTDGANALLRELIPLAQRVTDGFSATWDGNNTIGVLAADAVKAEDQILALCQAEFDLGEHNPRALVVWDAWATGADANTDAAVYAITATTTDPELDMVEERYQTDFRVGMHQPHLIIDRLGEWLRHVRDNRDPDDH